MKRIFYLLLTAALLVLPSGCKKKGNFDEAVRIAESYYKAVEDGNVNLSYGYLCDRPLFLQSEDGREMRFEPRPELETYRELFKMVPKLSVITIEPRTDLSNPDRELLVFEVKARVISKGLAVQSFLTHMGRNSKGDWSILLPATGGESSRTSRQQSNPQVQP
ncbi:hypothetical protein GF359_01405 [candidate division WOR-3 bacterium]|uniref:Uncharacterized protein n=1 Tax=candidate division WOR-3 bacterium TaxID=2052148 RepID=A0A9D5QCB3_UNCW3|nr:hypothetical protein [candidate division WOR-3 bacterium]MBD3363852.1 hypothetical protein [candidate division WOR-3 bacterium]